MTDDEFFDADFDDSVFDTPLDEPVVAHSDVSESCSHCLHNLTDHLPTDSIDISGCINCNCMIDSTGEPVVSDAVINAPVEFVDTAEYTADEIAAVAKESNEIAEIGRLLKEIKSSMTAFTMEIAPVKEEQKKINAYKEQAKQEYYAKLEAINEQDKSITSAIREAERKIKELQEKAESAERQLLQAIKVKKSEDELNRLTGEWDKLTLGAPWREFAKQHQMDGAKKMAWARGMILADVMGLGKTLTAIATADIVKAKTSEGETWYEEEWHEPQYVDGELAHKFSECDNCINGSKPYGHYGNVIHTAPPAGHRILYMSPAELVRNVEPEWIRWAPHRNKPVIMAKRDKITRQMMLDIVEDMDEFVIQLNYEAWRKDKAFLERLIKDGRFDTIILDEAHNLKDRKSMAYRGVRRIIDGKGFDGQKLADPIRYVFPMTGTPILNRPQELYTLLTLVDSKTYPDTDYGERQFLYDYCIKDNDTGKWTFQYGGLDRLAGRISNKFLRRDLNSAGIELPPQTVQIHELEVDTELYPKQAWARKEMREKAMIMLSADEGKAITAAAMIAVYTRLRQIETWPAGIKLRDKDGDVLLSLDVFESQKIDYIIREEANDGDFEWVGLLTEVCPNQRAVVYSQFKEPLRELERRANAMGLRAVILDGDTPDHVRQEIKVDFDRNRCREGGRIPKWDVVFANYRVGGAGLNLTDVTQTIILDEEWSPGKRDQAYGRTFRIGQTEETTVHVIRDERTIDTWLAAIIDEKEGMVGGFESAMGNVKDDFIEALKNGEL